MSSFAFGGSQVQRGKAAPMRQTMAMPQQSSALMALKKNLNPQQTQTPGAAAPDPTTATATNVDTTKSDAFQNKAIDSYNSTGDWAKQAGLNALSGAQRGASENAARMGLQSGGASYLAANNAGLVNGVNALNQNMANWAQGASQVYQGAANNALNTATTNAGFQNTASLNNTGYARDQLGAQQANNAAASTANVQAATNQYQAHKGWGATSAAGGAWSQAQQAYNNATAKGDTAGAQAALQQMNQIAQGSGYTSDGHSRNDPKLKDRADSHHKFSNGETWYYKGDNVIGKEDTNGNFTYTGS